MKTLIEANYDEVICPNCVTQFRAIPVNVQSELRAQAATIDRLEREAGAWALTAEKLMAERYTLAVAHKAEIEKLQQQVPIAYLAWHDGKPCWGDDDCVCQDAVYPVHADDDRVSMPVYLAAGAISALRDAIAQPESAPIAFAPGEYERMTERGSKAWSEHEATETPNA